jgi:hypothetical protein
LGFGAVVRLRFHFAFKLRRTRFALAVSGVAAPREARQGEAWWVRQGSNL